MSLALLLLTKSTHLCFVWICGHTVISLIMPMIRRFVVLMLLVVGCNVVWPFLFVKKKSVIYFIATNLTSSFSSLFLSPFLFLSFHRNMFKLGAGM